MTTPQGRQQRCRDCGKKRKTRGVVGGPFGPMTCPNEFHDDTDDPPRPDGKVKRRVMPGALSAERTPTRPPAPTRVAPLNPAPTPPPDLEAAVERCRNLESALRAKADYDRVDASDADSITRVLSALDSAQERDAHLDARDAQALLSEAHRSEREWAERAVAAEAREAEARAEADRERRWKEQNADAAIQTRAEVERLRGALERLVKMLGDPNWASYRWRNKVMNRRDDARAALTESPPPSQERCDEDAGWHIARGWNSDPFAADCPCGKAPCGFIDAAQIDPDCPQHAWTRAKTIRGNHAAKDCPAPPSHLDTAEEDR